MQTEVEQRGEKARGMNYGEGDQLKRGKMETANDDHWFPLGLELGHYLDVHQHRETGKQKEKRTYAKQ